MRRPGPARLLAPTAAVLAACASAGEAPPETDDASRQWCCVQGPDGLDVQYLGAGGWLFRMGETALLTAPFFSNPGVLDVGLGRIRVDTAAVDAFLPPVDDVQAILVGHAHYDHLMDVPYVLRRHAPEARMYGSRTAVNLLHGDPDLDPQRLVSVEEAAGDHESRGRWIQTPDGRIRFMPLVSEHAPHFMGIHLYLGQAEEPADRLPERAGEWVEGTPLAYLIDFLSADGEVIYRVHYQDAASSPPRGFPPPLEDGIPVDMAILCAPGYEEVADYPEGILQRLRPEHVMVGHWEDFFRPWGEELRPVAAMDLDEFVGRVEAATPPATRWAVPDPGTTFRIAAKP